MIIYSNKLFSNLKNEVKTISKQTSKALTLIKDLDKTTKEDMEKTAVKGHNDKIFQALRDMINSPHPDKYVVSKENKELANLSNKVELKLIKEIISKIDNDNFSNFNLDIVSKIIGKKIEFKATQSRYLDAYIGVYLHHYLGITRAEASRPEFWNSLVMSDSLILEYCIFRSQFGRSKPQKVKLSYFIVEQEQNLIIQHLLARPWWSVELTRNGSDYSTSIKSAVLGSMYTRRWGTMSLMHNKLFALSSSKLLLETDWPKKKGKYPDGRRYAIQNLPPIMNNFAATKNFDKEFLINEPDNLDAYDEWNKKRYKEFKDKINLLFGPEDLQIKQNSINKGTKILKDIARNSISTEPVYGPQKFL